MYRSKRRTCLLNHMAKIRGVNLGGWFVLESWMKPSLFEGIDGKDETYFMLNQENAEKKLIEHYETFITEKDFESLSKMSIRHVRLPVPWWFLGDKPYISSKKYIERAMLWAEKYHIHVLLDLHTAPGCQNGFDNGGITGVMDWHKDQNNLDRTIQSLIDLTSLFSHYPSFYGIEVLNEPHTKIDLEIILDFYEKAYFEIRKITDKPIVFHDAFRPKDIKWESFFKDKTNVIFDLHLYHCFDERLINGTEENHIREIIDKRLPMIENIQKFVPVVIGEWSLGLRKEEADFDSPFQYHNFIKLLAETQLFAYEKAYGYYFWSYHILRESHLNWDFTRSINAGYLPKSFE